MTSLQVGGIAVACLGSASIAAILQYMYDAVHYGHIIDEERDGQHHRD